ncbi:hypothetical protein ASPWEDRAFT_22929 [Aspergillus wentii DTO 134E9]|uniref:Uncharacterized protein n=1 Tax=Aspergillus wentii DTO 134E9 TaxID=1073089 RepID=A0A1L9S0T7_ASPWE|nr:uncharacterized protein ASPWEDRAFT_22929 [Aspergillus wentii DTO 134E9]KAI9931211.1 hypothetical protein MW887_010872 [Aspergillus wentii]OJJ40781.1 hypothetical protein ASPWEDRAFT_22929 [Aspergillus wentii DTO 134E9]
MPIDPHQGGTLSEMATGTTMPNDAGIQRTIPSVPRPDQKSEDPQFDNQGLAEPTSAFAADNATDLPRSTRDMGATGEVLSGTGNSIPAESESKRTQIGANNPGSKGSLRDFKHAELNRSAFDRYAKEDGDSGEYIGQHETRNE